MKRVLLFVAAGLLLCGAAGGAAAGGLSPLRPAGLRCELLENPLGIVCARPRLSWSFAAGDPARHGLAQSAYRIWVGRNGGGPGEDGGGPDGNGNGNGGAETVWDSGWVESRETFGIVYGGKPLVSDAAYSWTVRVRDGQGLESAPARARWATGPLDPSEWTARWIWTGEDFKKGRDEDRPFDPRFRKTVTLPAAPRQAFLHIASVGYHEVYVNGRKVDDTVLAPCVTDNRRRARSVTYDVAKLLKGGRNAIGVWLGAGWSIFPEFETGGRPNSPIFKLQCDARLPGGKAVRIQSGPDWKTAPGNSRLLGRWSFHNFGGEFLDGGDDEAGWPLPRFDDSSWKGAAVCDPPLAVTPQMVEPNRILTRIRAKKIEKLGNGAWYVDMGRNFAGWTEIGFEGEPGDVIDFSHCEVHGFPITFNMANRYRIGPSGRGVFRNRFNYNSGRWITIRGLKKPPRPDAVTGLHIRTDYARASSFRCSDDLMNWIYETTCWTFENLSLGGYTVDCPHRERMGYGGDAHGTCEAGLFNYRLDAFYAKWLEDWRDVQGRRRPWLADKSNRAPGSGAAVLRGTLPNTAPTYWGGGGPAWGGIVVTLPWRHYLQYGDKRVLADNFEMIDKWIGFLGAYAKDGLLRRYGGPWDFLGDWLWPGAPDGPNSHTPAALCLNSIYRVYNLRTAAKIARALGRDGKAAEWERAAGEGAAAVHKTYFHAEDCSYFDGGMGIQGAALLAGIPPAHLRKGAAGRLEKEILVNRKGHVGCGITAGALLFHWLRREGRDDLIYSMASQTDYPGWGFMRKHDATTLWEAWELNRGGHSLLHSSFLFLGPWFIDSVLGIRNAPESAGFRKIIVRPPRYEATPLRWAEGHYDSPNGRISVSWKKEEGTGKFRMETVIPPNASALLYVPSHGRADVSASGFCRWVKDVPGYSVYEAASGGHSLTSAGREKQKRDREK